VYLELRARRRNRFAAWCLATGGAIATLAAFGMLETSPRPTVPEPAAAVGDQTKPLARSEAELTAVDNVAPASRPRFEVGGTLAHGTEEHSVDTPAAPPATVGEVVNVEVAAGDTLMGMLLQLGIGRAEAHTAIEHLRDLYDPRRLRPGQRLQIETDAAARALLKLAFAPSGRERIELVRADDGRFEAQRLERPTLVEERLIEAEVRSSLHAAATAAGMPPAVLARVVRIFSWDVDYQRETRPGDRMTVLFERERVRGGPVIGTGDIRYARLEIGGRVLEAFHHGRHGEAGEFFDRNGHSLRKFLLRTPVSGARMSSGFGMRRHPILGYTRMHRGVDFAAPTGTPIYAAGAGRLVQVGRNGGYGNYIRIQHGNTYATAYAHLSRFADGMRPGRRVKQGEVIGYVGSTGRSTGPHLHFEVHKNGSQVDPLKLAQPPAAKLTGAQLAAFQREVGAIETRLADLGGRRFAADAASPDASDG
jgi:murein DD-endopeptidase MepM/ murein hydrolase activator NlpD